jgi:hypothetical protein
MHNKHIPQHVNLIKQEVFWRKSSSRMWRCVDIALTEVLEERLLTQDLHNATSQKTTFFIVTAVKASNLTRIILPLAVTIESVRLCVWNCHRIGVAMKFCTWFRTYRVRILTPSYMMFSDIRGISQNLQMNYGMSWNWPRPPHKTLHAYHSRSSFYLIRRYTCKLVK